MPLPMKTLQEASIELGMPEAEIRAMVEMNKVRAVIKKGVPTLAPDEIARLKRLRKSLPESAIKSPSTTTASQAKSVPPKKVPPRKIGQ